MPADQGLIDSVANENTKVGAGAPSFYGASAMRSHTEHTDQVGLIGRNALQNGITIAQNALQNGLLLGQVIVGALAKAAAELDITQAVANATLAQQGAKVAQSTPPATAKP